MTDFFPFCWFCGDDQDEDNDKVFDHVYDTYVHKGCIIDALMDDHDHPEAVEMAYLLEGDAQ